MDEIGFIVTHIDDNGFVFFHTLGGFDPKTLTAKGNNSRKRGCNGSHGV